MSQIILLTLGKCVLIGVTRTRTMCPHVQIGTVGIKFVGILIYVGGKAAEML